MSYSLAEVCWQLRGTGHLRQQTAYKRMDKEGMNVTGRLSHVLHDQFIRTATKIVCRKQL